jgi:hypothetical protein
MNEKDTLDIVIDKLRLLRDNIKLTRDNQGDCELALELEEWTYKLNMLLNYITEKPIVSINEEEEPPIHDHFSDYNRTEIAAMKESDKELHDNDDQYTYRRRQE